MSSLVIKISSLVIKSLSKPIANQIKIQAREHDRFRGVCVKLAQGIHQWDMRFRLGLLQDTAAIERQIARETAEAQAKKHKHEVSTVKTEAQTKADEASAAKSKEKGKDKAKEEPKKLPKIRPLSEAKAIDAGANFVSETFLLVVAVGLLFGERYYSSRKESSRREDVAERISELEDYEKSARRALVNLEKEVLRLRTKDGTPLPKQGHIIPVNVFEMEQKEESETEKPSTWSDWARAIFGSTSKDEQEDLPRTNVRRIDAPESEETASKSILNRIRSPASTASVQHDEKSAIVSSKR